MTEPERLWGLDPLLHVPMQLMIFQVKALARVPDYDGNENLFAFDPSILSLQTTPH